MKSETKSGGIFDPAAFMEYVTDAGQRTLLYWDTMRQRGNEYFDHMAMTVPHVLQFDFELVLSGRTLPEPVNYGIVRIVPPEGMAVDDGKRPFVIVDPRGGHGPGIGGFKADSEIGVALSAGHPCYFIGFTPNPEPGQTIEAVVRAMGVFIEKVAEMHPEADGKPVVIGNCQAGWALMMLSSIRPELCGPVILAGSPLSFWAGVRGENPMRYSGGLLGGSWLTALTGDLGNGKFDSAWLVQNFENLNPANTFWSKQYNLYANVDTEAPRYLGFERWWGGHVFFTAEEMQYIVDNLFVGNKLSSARMVTEDGISIDFRRIKSPIICFCSKGDNITPPQQALGWITDLYEDVDDIIASGQTIVYAVHEKTGHLGIFVSGSVVRKEHAEFASNIDLMDCLPPGLYEAVIEDKTEDSASEDLIRGDYISRFVERDLEDIRKLGENSVEEDRCFASVERLSDVTHGLYRMTAQPVVRSMVTEHSAELLHQMHPLRVAYEMFSDRDPFMQSVASLAETVKNNRRPVSSDNPFLQWQHAFSDLIANSLDFYRDVRDSTMEFMFFGTFGRPLLQAMSGLRATDGPPRRHPGKDPEHMALIEHKKAELRSRIREGGPLQAAIRALLYVSMPQKAVDEREFEMLLRIRSEYGAKSTLAEYKENLRTQYFTILVDEQAAIEAIPFMLEGQEDEAARFFDALRRIATAGGSLNEEAQRRLAEMERLFVSQPAES